MVATFIFDVDDTLYDQLEPFRRAFQKHFSQFENEVKIEELYKLSRKYSDEAFETTGYEITNMRKMHIYRISKAFEALGIRITDKESLQFQLDYETFQNEIKLIEEFSQILNCCSKEAPKSASSQTVPTTTNSGKSINWVSKNGSLPKICWSLKQLASPNLVKKSSKRWKGEWFSRKMTYITLGTISIMT